MAVFTGIPELARDYEIGERLGEGGYGVVVKAFHKRLRKLVVIKEAKLAVSEDKARAEVDILKNLHHPNLPQVYDFFTANGVSYTVMDYIDGESVGSMLKKGRKFSTKEVYKYSKQLLQALDHLHSRKIPIIHGDIKPDNIMITPDGNLCLIDFNISGVTDGKQAYTIGYTPGYGAPEQEKEFKKILEQVKKAKEAAAYRAGGNSRPASANMNNRNQYDDATEVVPRSGYDPDATEVVRNPSDPDLTEVTGGHPAQQAYPGVQAIGSKVPNPQANSNGAAGIQMKIPIDKRSDVYSAGATIYRMYTGMVYDRTKPAVLGSGTSEAFLYVLNMALQTDPNRRFQSGGEMLKAIDQIYKKDKGYRGLVVRTAIFRVLLVAAIVAGIVIIREGRITKENERQNEYSLLIDSIEQKRASNDRVVIPTQYGDDRGAYGTEETESDREVNEFFDKATTLYPDREDAYYQMALWLYENGRYPEGAGFVTDVLQDAKIAFDPSVKANMYYILGNCYFQLGYFEDAASSFEKAVEYDSSNANIYVDYAISLSSLGKYKESREILENARKMGVEDDLLLLTEGEIGLKENLISAGGNGTPGETDSQTVLDCFLKCIATSSDDYVIFRAGIGAGQAYETIIRENSEDIQRLEELHNARTSLFTELARKLPQKYRLQIYENQIQYCDKAFVTTGDTKYNDQAILALNGIIDMGYATRTTYENMCNIYRRQKNYVDALNTLKTMDRLYPGNYRVYMLFAFTYAEIEAEKDVDSRDYSAFYDSYLKADEAYTKQSEQDMEMQNLQLIYRDIAENGWL
ncbi:MAG: protein kinase [Lachnospiraceae bacterium]|nr:protein kinase [Lachnospiraceae bacterium]